MKWRQSKYDAFPDVVGLSLGLLGLSLPRSHRLALLIHFLVGVIQLENKSEMELMCQIGLRGVLKEERMSCKSPLFNHCICLCRRVGGLLPRPLKQMMHDLRSPSACLAYFMSD